MTDEPSCMEPVGNVEVFPSESQGFNTPGIKTVCFSASVFKAALKEAEFQRKEYIRKQGGVSEFTCQTSKHSVIYNAQGLVPLCVFRSSFL